MSHRRLECEEHPETGDVERVEHCIIPQWVPGGLLPDLGWLADGKR